MKQATFNRLQELDEFVEVSDLGAIEAPWLSLHPVFLNEPLNVEQPFGSSLQLDGFLLKKPLVVGEAVGQPLTLLRPIDRPMPLSVECRLPQIPDPPPKRGAVRRAELGRDPLDCLPGCLLCPLDGFLGVPPRMAPSRPGGRPAVTP